MTNTTADFLARVDNELDRMMAELGCIDGSDTRTATNQQHGPDGFRIQVTRRRDGKTQTSFVPRNL